MALLLAFPGPYCLSMISLRTTMSSGFHNILMIGDQAGELHNGVEPQLALGGHRRCCITAPVRLVAPSLALSHSSKALLHDHVATKQTMYAAGPNWSSSSR